MMPMREVHEQANRDAQVCWKGVRVNVLRAIEVLEPWIKKNRSDGSTMDISAASRSVSNLRDIIQWEQKEGPFQSLWKASAEFKILVTAYPDHLAELFARYQPMPDVTDRGRSGDIVVRKFREDIEPTILEAISKRE